MKARVPIAPKMKPEILLTFKNVDIDVPLLALISVDCIRYSYSKLIGMTVKNGNTNKYGFISVKYPEKP